MIQRRKLQVPFVITGYLVYSTGAYTLSFKNRDSKSVIKRDKDAVTKSPWFYYMFKWRGLCKWMEMSVLVLPLYISSYGSITISHILTDVTDIKHYLSGKKTHLTGSQSKLHHEILQNTVLYVLNAGIVIIFIIFHSAETVTKMSLQRPSPPLWLFLIVYTTHIFLLNGFTRRIQYIHTTSDCNIAEHWRYSSAIL